jgi:hypothetical protein
MNELSKQTVLAVGILMSRVLAIGAIGALYEIRERGMDKTDPGQMQMGLDIRQHRGPGSTDGVAPQQAG